MILPVGRREEKKAQTRQRLLDAAAIVFARKGFAATSLDEVAEEAGLTKGAVYSNFDSKEDLINTLLHERLDRPYAAIADEVDLEAPQPTQAAQATALMDAIGEQERDMYLLGLEFAVYRARNPEVARKYGGDRELRRQMAALIERQAAARGVELPMPAEELTLGLFALGNGLALERLLDPQGVPEGLFAKLLALLVPDAEAPKPTRRRAT